LSYDATQRDLLSYTSKVPIDSPKGVLINSLTNSGLSLNEIKGIFKRRNFCYSEKYIKKLILAVNDSFKDKCNSHLIVIDDEGSYIYRSWLL
jgi:hypothetical protein